MFSLRFLSLECKINYRSWLNLKYHTPPTHWVLTEGPRVLSTESVCRVPAECLLSARWVPTLGRHPAGTRWTLSGHLLDTWQTHSVDNTWWILAEHSVRLVVYSKLVSGSCVQHPSLHLSVNALMFEMFNLTFLRVWSGTNFSKSIYLSMLLNLPDPVPGQPTIQII